MIDRRAMALFEATVRYLLVLLVLPSAYILSVLTSESPDRAGLVPWTVLGFGNQQITECERSHCNWRLCRNSQEAGRRQPLCPTRMKTVRTFVLLVQKLRLRPPRCPLPKLLSAPANERWKPRAVPGSGNQVS
ncbi:uncharacterized protein F5Z01DRAFT_664550 [Emericellopsis atlantica]|uniref:Uncharacterized protein n=1 Tax=Emericellopsis atlantica TaxID=2614577 RepID=A0A9P8CMV2_9HYPO|nr:uncharacterized protein F5Z01DRAFT_664550 [Emericellopsis atlantica]KAG9251086.1 hypothetical protein F5Z01DRAFT_664550 [Emericellopsis atlantica]